MDLERTNFDGLFVIHAFSHKDNRGQFVKPFSVAEDDKNLHMDIKEVYYSVSRKGVIRGMHFQTPPMDHDKIVFVSHGEIVDVCVDLRRNSETFGQVFNRRLSSQNNLGVFIPKGFAHGFETLSDHAVVHYLQSTTYSKECDSGILWNSIGYNWFEQNPVISDRDKSFVSLREYIDFNKNWF